MTSTNPTRRTAVKLPSRRKHAAMALGVLACAVGIPVIATHLIGDSNDATAGGQIAVAPLPVIAPPAPLDDETLDTPDLLAGDVPEGANPTETLVETKPKTDALGNPVSTPSPSSTSKTFTIGNVGARALPKAPITGLTRRTNFGPVPSRTAGNALAAYRRPFTPKSGKRPVSMIIGGLGVDQRLTREAINALPADVTLSFAAHSTGLQGWIDTARSDGHEVLIEISMESDGFNPSEPGADKALRVSDPAEITQDNLNWALARGQGYAGIINFNGELFLQRTDIAAPFVDYLSQTGLGFLTDGDFKTPSLESLSKSTNLPFKAGHGIIDPDPIPRVISARLNGLSQAAQSGSHPVGAGFGYPETLQEVLRWIESLEANGLELAPATAALK